MPCDFRLNLEPSDYISCFFVPRNKILLLFIFFSDNYRLLYGMFGPWANIGVSV